MIRRVALLVVCVLGLAVMAVCGFYVLSDWAALRHAFANFERVVAQNKDVRSVTVANTLQMTYRINCFADGVGFLLGAIVAAIGIHGLCLLPAHEVKPGPAGNQTRPQG